MVSRKEKIKKTLKNKSKNKNKYNQKHLEIIKMYIEIGLNMISYLRDVIYTNSNIDEKIKLYFSFYGFDLKKRDIKDLIVNIKKLDSNILNIINEKKIIKTHNDLEKLFKDKITKNKLKMIGGSFLPKRSDYTTILLQALASTFPFNVPIFNAIVNGPLAAMLFFKGQRGKGTQALLDILPLIQFIPQFLGRQANLYCNNNCDNEDLLIQRLVELKEFSKCPDEYIIDLGNQKSKRDIKNDTETKNDTNNDTENDTKNDTENDTKNDTENDTDTKNDNDNIEQQNSKNDKNDKNDKNSNKLFTDEEIKLLKLLAKKRN